MTRHFAASVLAGEIPDDLQPDISNLLGFAKNFYLQFFEEQFSLQVVGFNAEGRKRVLSLARRLRREESPDLALVSHYLNMADVLADKATSDTLDPDEEREEVLRAVSELLKRIEAWARHLSLPDLAVEALATHDEFEEAVTLLVD